VARFSNCKELTKINPIIHLAMPFSLSKRRWPRILRWIYRTNEMFRSRLILWKLQRHRREGDAPRTKSGCSVEFKSRTTPVPNPCFHRILPKL